MIDIAKLHDEIEAAYQASGNSQGWRFLYSNRSVLETASVAIIGWNPGGIEEVEGHGQFDMPIGTSAYADEDWKKGNGTYYGQGNAPYQLQVRAVCERLSVEPREVLAGNLILWRSRKDKALIDRRSAVSFGAAIWGHVLEKVRPSIIIAVGISTGERIAKILNIATDVRHRVGWGEYEAIFGTNGRQKLIALPHLSTFKIMKHANCQTHLDDLFAKLT
ncbi:hypothetical protein ASG39_22825 [Rhizobium sp. Leaf371]|uniref:hypothetical protein n=1 Tax=Rhizobium sp. Leaf371 TaxID=1736355 RepID=UPI000714E144|nr:hypothetical protein [Rhizobium sp. Leaf371]KQS67562.1 hypothetical protein ASG39_22825 [Rhizobium sp. Leaf371]